VSAVAAWLRLRGVRWCPVTAFVSPGPGWQREDTGPVPAIIAIRIHRAPDALDSLSLELEGGAVWLLLVRHVREVAGGAVHELVAELRHAAA